MRNAANVCDFLSVLGEIIAIKIPFEHKNVLALEVSLYSYSNH